MSVVTPIKPRYGRDLDNSALATLRDGMGMSTALAWPSARSVRLPRLTCAMALILTDMGAFLLSAYLAALAATAVTGEPSVWLQHAPGSDGEQQALALTLGVPLLGVLLAFARGGQYWRRVPFWSALRDMLTASLLALLCGGFLQYSMQRHDSRLLLGLAWALFPLTTVASRTVVRSLLDRAGLWQLRVVVVGQADTAKQAERALLSEPRLGYHVAGVVHPGEFSSRDGSAYEAGQWRHVLRRHAADLLVLSLDTCDPTARALTESLVRERVPFAAMPRLDGLPVLGFEQTSFFSHDTIMFTYRNNLARPVSRAAKIAFDLCAASLLLLAAAPVLAFIAIAVKLDGGPALFAHKRVGAGGQEFPCLKFRSMVTNSDTVLHSLLESDPAAAAEWAETRKLRRDPRVTWIGKLLRTTSLDELPQLFNVLRLEMSLVGPRPIVRSEMARYAEDIVFYCEARPGLTGLWQVSGRSDTSYAHRVQLDTWYVKNWTLWHDLAILAKTVPAVLKRQGAA